FPRLVRFRAFSNARPISWKPSIATAARIPSRLPKWAYKTGWLYEISSDSRRTVTLDHPSSSAIRRAALIICARRACLSRSFRSAIRLAANVFAIDRKYSAASMNAADVESFANSLHQNLALLDFLGDEHSMRDAIPLSLAVLMAVGIIVIGCFYLVSPERISGTFGLKPPASDADTRAWLRPKGIRDVVAGLVVLTMMLTAGTRMVGIALLVEAVIPFGDMSIILGSGGSKSRAFFVHGVTCAVMLVVGLLLIHAI